MIDIHAHILPGIDDGAADWAETMEMAALAVESGVDLLVATPHAASSGKAKNWMNDDLVQLMLSFRRRLAEEKIPLKVVAGMEIFGTDQVPRLLREGKLMGLNGSRYPLLEFPFVDYAAEATDILEEIVADGMRPVVAHPERYDYVQRDPSLLNLWTEMGCLLQINRGSLLGRFGRREQLLAEALVMRGFAFAVASDAHSCRYRTTWMQDVQEYLRREISPQAAWALLERNPLALVNNEDVPWEEPHWF